MTDSILSPSDVFTLLKNIDDRSRQGYEQHNNGLWTVIDLRINNEKLVIPLNQTREIFPVPQQITPVPKSQKWVFGIANLRGELLPLFDLKQYLFGEPTTVKKRSRIVVINHPELYAGLLIDEVIGLKHVQHAQSKHSTTNNQQLQPYLDGSISQQDTTWNIFSFEKLSSEDRFLKQTS